MRFEVYLLACALIIGCSPNRGSSVTVPDEPVSRVLAADRQDPLEQEGSPSKARDGLEDDWQSEHASPNLLPGMEGVEPAEDPRRALFAGVEASDAGRFGEALALFRSALAAAPTWSAAHLETAHALLMVGGDTRLIGQHLEQARLLERDSPRLHYIEGLLMEEIRKPERAAAAYERAVDVRPSMLDARLRLGRLLLQEGQLEGATEHLESAVRLAPALLPARANLASAYEAAGRIDDAASQLETVASLFPDNPFHLQRLADLYERHGRTADAREVMRRVEQLGPAEERPRMRPLLPSRR